MGFSSFAFILTTACNFSCSYCYQPHSCLYLDTEKALKTADFFFPFLDEGSFINFYGGEPLLAFDVMREVVSRMERLSERTGKKVGFSITTNGSLVTDEILAFFDRHRFSVLLSFDGPAQNDGRRKGSRKMLESVLCRMLECPGVDLAVSSVFTQATLKYLEPAVSFFMSRGVPRIDFTFSTITAWEESDIVRLNEAMDSLRPRVLAHYRQTGKIPAVLFKKEYENKIFSCAAGKQRLALSPEGYLWGCCFFYDLARIEYDIPLKSRYALGDLDDFIHDPERIFQTALEKYARLDMNYFFTREGLCLNCPEIRECAACPAYEAYASSIVGMIPVHACRIRKVLHTQVRKFREEADKISS